METRTRTKEVLRQLLVAVVAFVAAGATREGVFALTGIQLQYLTFFPAVIAATLFGGIWGGLFTTIFGASMAVHWSHAPEAFQASPAEDVIILGLFLSTSLLIVGMGWLVRHARRTTEESLRESQRAAAELTEANQVVRQTLDSITDAFVALDSQWRFSYVNPATPQILGKAAKELLGKSIWDVFPNAPSTLRAHLERAMRDRVPAEFEISELSVDRSFFVKAYPRAEGGVSIFFRDITEHLRAERRLAVRHAITRVLVESSSIEDAVGNLLKATCESLGWKFGALWLVEQESSLLRCKNIWIDPGFQCVEFEHMTRNTAFPRGIGLPGRIWSSAMPAWIPDVVRDNNFPRARFADKDELHAALGFPIVLDGEILGVLEFFGHEIQQPDPDLLQTMASLGSQLGQFIKRKRAEEALRASEARKAAVLDTALDAIISIDHEGKVVEFNPAAQHMFGYSQEQVLGQSLAELLVPARLRESHRQGIAHYLATGEGPVLNRRIEQMALRSDGTEFPVELSITRLSAEGPPVFTSYIRDITEQKQAAQAVQESERRFGRFMQHLPGLAWSKDLAGRYVYANDAALKAFNKPLTDLYGKTDVELFPLETAVLFQENDRRALDGESGYQSIETLQHEDGTVHSSIVSKFPIPGPDGTPALIGGMAIDITDRLKMEESLKEADRRKDEFLATLAHELRNPLAPISNALHILRLSGEMPPAAERVREIMERQVNHLVRLVEDLLEVSRVTRGKIELRKEPVELASVIESAVDTSRPLVETAGHQLAIAISPDVITLQADPVRLVQVISNLLNNAAKYTDPGGQIWLTAQREGGEVMISVRDNGMGIPAEMLPRVFDMFAQVDRSLKRSQGGLGIGLTLAKNLVQMHGGQIEVRSEGLGKGSEFVIRLPLPEKSASLTSTPTKPISHKPLPVRRILVVDDTHAAVFILGRLLEALGQQVRTANSGAAALEVVQQERPDVIISDIAMPGMDGYELAGRLRKEPGLENVVLVALTGYSQDSDRQRARTAGFNYHLVKPVSMEALQDLLGSLPLAAQTGVSGSRA